jgi:hypothetical protein
MRIPGNFLLALIPPAMFFFAAAQPSRASILTYNVSFNTSFLTAPSYDLNFQFAQGDPSEMGSNTAHVTNLSIPGSSDFFLGDGVPPFSGEEDVNFSPGAPVTFTIAITANVTSLVTPDLLTITIFNNTTGNPVTTTDPNPNNSSLIYFTESTNPANPGITTAVYDTPTNQFKTSVILAPEPGTLALGALGCLLPLTLARRRTQYFK